jgi:hypothetical protein
MDDRCHQWSPHIQQIPYLERSALHVAVMNADYTCTRLEQVAFKLFHRLSLLQDGEYLWLAIQLLLSILNDMYSLYIG